MFRFKHNLVIAFALVLNVFNSLQPVLAAEVSAQVNVPEAQVAVAQTIPANVATIPFSASSRAMLVDATLNNSVKQTFIFDTGATYTAISRETAKSLNLDYATAEWVTITTANGRIAVPKLKLSSLSVNGVVLKDVEVTVLYFPPGSGYGGLLGLSVIRRFHVTIDPMGNQLVLRPV